MDVAQKRELIEIQSVPDWRSLARCSTAEARALLSLELAERLLVLPLGVHGADANRCLSLLAAAPPSAQVVSELRFATGLEPVFELVPEKELRAAIAAAYRGQCTVEEQSIPLLLEGLIHRALYLDASDVHLESVGSRMRVRFRVDGALREDTGFAIEGRVADELLRRIKVLCRIGAVAPYKPQEGAFGMECGGRRLRIRVSIVRQAQGAKAVLRVLSGQATASVPHPDPFCSLGLDARQAALLQSALGGAQGVILSAGPTGSGKSTLLYRAIEYLNEGSRNIVTIEDPVERILLGVTQIEVATAEGQSFGELLPVLLRQDPDVILIGEIRDRRSGDTALNAGITGHLVLSTVHANGALEALRRLRFMGIDLELIASSIRLVIGQRLVPRNCRACLAARNPTAALARLFRLSDSDQVAIGVGCASCERSGVAGRIGVFELLPISRALREAISADPRSCSLEAIAADEGFVSYAAQVRTRLLEGVISPRAALQCLGVGPELAGY